MADIARVVQLPCCPRENDAMNRDKCETRRRLRREATEAEQILWHHLRASRTGHKFRRQHSIGPFIADFYCAAAALIVELDGAAHLDEQVVDNDERRSAWLTKHGFRVLRIENVRVLESPDAVVATILRAITSA